MKLQFNSIMGFFPHLFHFFPSLFAVREVFFFEIVKIFRQFGLCPGSFCIIYFSTQSLQIFRTVCRIFDIFLHGKGIMFVFFIDGFQWINMIHLSHMIFIILTKKGPGFFIGFHQFLSCIRILDGFLRLEYFILAIVFCRTGIIIQPIVSIRFRELLFNPISQRSSLLTRSRFCIKRRIFPIVVFQLFFLRIAFHDDSPRISPYW